MPGPRSRTQREKIEHQKHNGIRDEHITSACGGYHITSALFLLPAIRNRRCSICALDFFHHHLRALAIASSSPCLRNRAGFSQHQSTTAATKSNQTSPWVLTACYDLCDATEEHHAMAVVGVPAVAPPSASVDNGGGCSGSRVGSKESDGVVIRVRHPRL